MRINARLDESSEEKIEKIKRITKKSTTDIIKESVDLITTWPVVTETTHLLLTRLSAHAQIR